MICLCGSQKNYADCCGVFIQGAALPTTPEQLMRSRFTAYATGKIDYIQQTMRGKAAEGFNLSETRRSNRYVKWLDLKIISAPPALDQQGYVEFQARYLFKGKISILHEKSIFLFEEGRWFYVDR